MKLPLISHESTGQRPSSSFQLSSVRISIYRNASKSRRDFFMTKVKFVAEGPLSSPYSNLGKKEIGLQVRMDSGKNLEPRVAKQSPPER